MPPPLPDSSAALASDESPISWGGPCPDCSEFISSSAETCPRCGAAELHARRRAGSCKKCKGPLYFAGREMRGHFDGGGLLTVLLGLGLIVWGVMSMLIVGANLIALGVVSVGIGGLGMTVARVNRFEVLWFRCRACKITKEVKR